MPIDLYAEGDELRVRQSFSAPAIYLDHWAICTFSDDRLLQDRLVAAVHKKRATFLLSHTNLAEFTAPSDVRHAVAAESFFDRLLPHVYLSDVDLEKAEAWENNASSQAHRICPSPDLQMLKFLAEQSLRAGHRITFQGFVRLSHEYRAEIGTVFRQANQDILELLKAQRADPSYVRKARTSIPNNRRSTTQMVMGELIRELVIDPKAEITINDIVDWQHSVLPIVSCDYVLLDQKWEQRVTTLQKRCAQHQRPIRLARCFSARNNGVTRFLEALECS